ncbi:IDEAL domain-containing protein [Lentibacillus sp. Marseille-P4043]|uniref:IDEAL domain-containing protein n=1 Tax=Lentibacillus sp. Marseille-P4043 TaxID=2040293 RepID=UPI000D0BC3BE|nr:IDEAL domain-containing protein [Lentibacillus sp. Marseille-P4043]
MVTVKMLKPYYIKADDDYVRVILAYQYFAIVIHDQLYHFVPVEAKEIRINRRTQKVDNIEDKFAFQKGKDIIHIAMTELISLPDFLIQIRKIAQPYYHKELKSKNTHKNEIAIIIDELEQNNIMRLIDKALDERNQQAFYSLTKWL